MLKHFSVIPLLLSSWICLQAQTPTLQLLPSNASAPRGGEAVVSVRAVGFPAFRAYTIRVKYDPSALHCLSVKQERYFAEYSTFWFPSIDSSAGLAGADESILGVGSSEGDRTLFSLRFRILGEGPAQVRFEAYSANDSALKTIAPIAVQDAMITVHVKDAPAAPDDAGMLIEAWPNPSTDAVHISLTKAAAGNADVRVYSSDGRCVRLLYDGYLERGIRRLLWDGRCANGAPAPSGAYFVVAATRFGFCKKAVIRQ